MNALQGDFVRGTAGTGLSGFSRRRLTDRCSLALCSKGSRGIASEVMAACEWQFGRERFYMLQIRKPLPNIARTLQRLAVPMKGDRGSWRGKLAAQCVLGGVGLSVVTFLCFRFGITVASVAFAYLTLVTLLSLIGSWIGSLILSIAAVFCLNYFFTNPVFSFRTAYPEDVLALAAFLTSSLLVTGLVARLQRATQALRDSEKSASERRFRLVVEAAPNAMVMIDPAGKIVMVNTQAERVFGYSRAELVGQPVEMLVPERFRGHHPELRKTFFADPRPRPMGAGRDLYGLKKDGSEFPVEIGLNPIETDEGTMVLSAIVDITARKAAELALRESEQRYSLLVDGVTDYAIYMLDPNGIVTNWNRGAQRIKGYRTEEIVGQHFSCFYTEEDRAANVPQQSLEIAARDGRYEAEAWRVRKDGSRFLANVVIDALKDDSGQLIGFAKITRDVTERVQAARELEEARISLVQSRAEEALRRAQAELAHVARLTTLGELTASIAHEVNQPLAGLVSSANACLNWLASQPPNIEKARQSVERIIKDGKRASEIIQRVRALATKASIQKAPLDINNVINEVIALVQA